MYLFHLPRSLERHLLLIALLETNVMSDAFQGFPYFSITGPTEFTKVEDYHILMVPKANGNKYYSLTKENLQEITLIPAVARIPYLIDLFNNGVRQYRN